jgi:hypothetical protein
VRTLIVIPMIHTEQDMGSLLEQSKQAYVKRARYLLYVSALTSILLLGGCSVEVQNRQAAIELQQSTKTPGTAERLTHPLSGARQNVVFHPFSDTPSRA